MTGIGQLATPCLLLDNTKLQANCRRMTGKIQKLGVRLRPHMKTAKSREAAQLAVAGNFGGIAAATLNEADYFAHGGFRDIQYAVCITPDKFARAAALIRDGIHLSLLTDSPQMASALDTAGREMGVIFPVFIEIDSGDHRTGLLPDGPQLLETAAKLHQGANTALMGILTHAGHAYEAHSPAEITAVAQEECQMAVLAAQRLKTAGLPCPQVSVGSTPTACFSQAAEGITEYRAGVYLFGDAFQAGLGTCEHRDVAISVLTTVISHQPQRNRLIVDAGALALSKDRSTQGQRLDCGFGLVMGADGHPPSRMMTVVKVSQEHGEITCNGSLDFKAHPIGSRLRILPNHACMTAAMYGGYHLIDGQTHQITGFWQRTNGW